jgi:hypothetical protein
MAATNDVIISGRIVADLRSAIVRCNLNQVPEAVRRAIESGAWRERLEFQQIYKFDRFVDFISKSPVDGGMGWKPDLVDGLLQKAGDVEVLTMWREAMTLPKHVHRADADNISIKPKHGTSRAYALTRLKHERPDLYARVVAKEISANAAAIDAGFRKKPTKRIRKCPQCGYDLYRDED